MPTYVTLGRFTAKGAADMRGMPARIKANRELARANGGEIKAVYAALGQYDLITVFEAPNDEAAAPDKSSLPVALLSHKAGTGYRAAMLDSRR